MAYQIQTTVAQFPSGVLSRAPVCPFPSTLSSANAEVSRWLEGERVSRSITNAWMSLMDDIPRADLRARWQSFGKILCSHRHSSVCHPTKMLSIKSNEMRWISKVAYISILWLLLNISFYADCKIQVQYSIPSKPEQNIALIGTIQKTNVETLVGRNDSYS